MRFCSILTLALTMTMVGLMSAAEPEAWEDQAVFRINKEPPRVASIPFPDREGALTHVASESPWWRSLNHRPPGLEHQPIPHELTGYDGPCFAGQHNHGPLHRGIEPPPEAQRHDASGDWTSHQVL